ncbi:MAG: hypothetical protein HPY76_10445 [Anaerolineae bacterium]|nr:hypothetical protein [Anaerolineae bacterium]
MDSNYWSIWARFLRRWGLQQPVTALLESSGSLTSLAAQLVYLSQPLFAAPENLPAWQSLASMLENPQQSQTFANYLRQEPHHDDL